MKSPFISICIPAYNRTDFLKRLLDSIVIQNYSDFEVVVTDDSDTNDVEVLVDGYKEKFKLVYHKNSIALGTPENWNEAIRQAKGKWIKLMHDDDWFVDENSLKQFADAAINNEGAFIFAAYNNFYKKDNRFEVVTPSKWRKNMLSTNPSILIAKNFIGPPSVILHPNDNKYFYDKELKWLVDIDMYVSRIPDATVQYINRALVNVGISNTQVTAQVKNNPQIEIPEFFRFINKHSLTKTRNIIVYDYYWRFIRNFHIRSLGYFAVYGYELNIPNVLNQIIRFQRHVPVHILQKGIFSKFLMTISYIKFLINKKS